MLLAYLTICQLAEAQTAKPNILLVMADDVGFSDIGCYGGEVQTPHLDRLAAEGMRFRTFYNMAKCNPTRSTMLTGLYSGGDGAVHLAQLTKQAGYHNIMSGKEHFDSWVPDYCATDKVFDHSFHLWASTEYFKPPNKEFRRPYHLEGKELKAAEIKHRIKPMYQTDFITDYALDWLDEAYEKEQPFFLYLPYHAAHFPLQARPEDIAKYRGKYMRGWDTLRRERYERMQQLDILPENATLSKAEGNLNTRRGPLIPSYTDYYAWNTLDEPQKDTLDLEMAVYAAMIDRMDQNIGRVLASLEANGKLDNTLILFLVDNGACPFYVTKNEHIPPGSDSSYWGLRSTWANLANTPYRQYKQAGFEGGSHTPFIAFWRNNIAPNSITDAVGHVVDLAPTFLDVLNIPYPDSIKGFPTLPLHGRSLMPIFKNGDRAEPDYFLSGTNGFRMYRSGDYKITQLNSGDWELYNLKSDPMETKNLAKKEPNQLEALKAEFAKVEGLFHGAVQTK